MQNQQYVRQSSGSKAIAIDNRPMYRRYLFLQAGAAIVSALTAVGLHLIFAR